MQEIKINGIDYVIPLDWSQLIYSKAIRIIKDYNDKTLVLSHASGIPVETINKLSDTDVSNLFGLISFTEDLSVFENVTPKDEFKSFKFKSIQYGEAEYCRNLMNNGSSGYEVIIKVIERLTAKDISNEPLTEIIGTANFFLTNSVISMIVTPSLTKAKLRPNNKAQGLEDSIILGALELMLNSQEKEPLGEPLI
jgi:hypothetical protein